MRVPDATGSRFGSVAGEVARFLTVGGVGFVVDVAVFNLLRFDAGFGDGQGVLYDKPLTAKVISVVLATIVTYIGNRTWTWGDRQRTGVLREYALFFVLNGIAMAIAVITLGISHYILGFTSPLADNISANIVGLAMGTTFRFFAYRRWVFKEPAARPGAAVAPVTAQPASEPS